MGTFEKSLLCELQFIHYTHYSCPTVIQWWFLLKNTHQQCMGISLSVVRSGDLTKGAWLWPYQSPCTCRQAQLVQWLNSGPQIQKP